MPAYFSVAGTFLTTPSDRVFDERRGHPEAKNPGCRPPACQWAFKASNQRIYGYWIRSWLVPGRCYQNGTVQHSERVVVTLLRKVAADWLGMLRRLDDSLSVIFFKISLF
jgi:hypothetical protein